VPRDADLRTRCKRTHKHRDTLCRDHDQCSALSKADFRAANSARPACLFALRLLGFLVAGPPSWRMRFRLARGRCTTCLNAPPKGIHKVHDVCRLGPLGALDGLAFLLFSASSYWSSKLLGSKCPVFVFTICSQFVHEHCGSWHQAAEAKARVYVGFWGSSGSAWTGGLGCLRRK
jgi:hypothetical protein